MKLVRIAVIVLMLFATTTQSHSETDLTEEVLGILFIASVVGTVVGIAMTIGQIQENSRIEELEKQVEELKKQSSTTETPEPNQSNLTISSRSFDSGTGR